MKLVSWNVNGIRAAVNKGFYDFFREIDADIFCIQETKMQEGQLIMDLKGYHQYWYSADKKGYSGTAVFSKQEPINVVFDGIIEKHHGEGRIIACEFEKFYLVNAYVPNSQDELRRLVYRMEWERDFLIYLKSLDDKKPIIYCGDLNVAHQEIDLKNPKTNRRNAGFTDEERECMTVLLKAGFVDSFRYLYPDKTEAYSWWSYRMQARQRNTGWRIDYFIVSERLKEKIVGSTIYADIYGSDHCPVGLEIDI